MSLDPRFGLAAAALLLAGTAGAALAHPHPDGDTERKVERIVVLPGGEDGDKAGDAVRRIRIVRVGDHPAGHGAVVECDGGEKIVDEDAGEDGRKSKIVLCAKSGAPTAMTAERLEQALARIQADDALSDAQKARIETALRSAMERTRTAP